MHFNFVLGSKKSSTHPTRETSCLGTRGVRFPVVTRLRPSWKASLPARKKMCTGHACIPRLNTSQGGERLRCVW